MDFNDLVQTELFISKKYTVYLKYSFAISFEHSISKTMFCKYLVACLWCSICVNAQLEPTESYPHHVTMRSGNAVLKLYWNFNDTDITFEVKLSLLQRAILNLLNEIFQNIWFLGTRWNWRLDWNWILSKWGNDWGRYDCRMGERWGLLRYGIIHYEIYIAITSCKHTYTRVLRSETMNAVILNYW